MALTAGESAYSRHIKIPICRVIWEVGVWRLQRSRSAPSSVKPSMVLSTVLNGFNRLICSEEQLSIFFYWINLGPYD